MRARSEPLREGHGSSQWASETVGTSTVPEMTPFRWLTGRQGNHLISLRIEARPLVPGGPLVSRTMKIEEIVCA